MDLRPPRDAAPIAPVLEPPTAHDPRPGDPLRLLTTALFLTAVLAVLHLSLLPFEIDFDVGSIKERWRLAARNPWPDSYADHALGFLGFGVVLAMRRWSWVWLIGVVAIVECTQAVFVGRHPRIGDGVVNLIAGGLGVVLGSVAWRRGAEAWLRARAVPVARALGLIVVAGAAANAWLAYRGGELCTWDASFPFAVGDEANGSRPWRGELPFVAVYGRALCDGEAQQLAATPWRGLADGSRRRELAPLVAYDLSGPVAEVAAATELVRGAPAATLRSRGSPRALATDVGGLADAAAWIAANDAFTVECRVRPEDGTQYGPARIVTLSPDPLHRDFTLGQERDELVVRVRNRFSGENGTLGAGSFAGILDPRRERHLVVRYDRGLVTVFANGEVRARHSMVRAANRERPGAAGYGVLLALVWCFPIGCLFGIGWPRRGLAAVVATTLVLAALDAVGALSIDHVPSPAFAIACPLLGVAGFLAVREGGKKSRAAQESPRAADVAGP